MKPLMLKFPTDYSAERDIFLERSGFDDLDDDVTALRDKILKRNKPNDEEAS